jgi:hypothetical protein
MPKIEVPLPSYDEFKELKRATAKRLLARRVELYRQQSEVKKELGELNRKLFALLSSVLPDGVKSVEFDGCQVGTIVGSARKSLSTSDLLTIPFECPHCEEELTLPANVLVRSYRYGKEPEPTVGVRMIGQGEDEEEGETE